MSASSDAHQPRQPPGRLADRGRSLSGWLASRDDEPTSVQGSQSKRQSRHGGLASGQQEYDLHRDEGDGERRNKPRLAGGNKAIVAFALSLVAFTIQTEAAQYVQQSLGYRKPFLSLYIGHSAFTSLFPLYLLCLKFAEPNVPLSHQLHLVALNLHWQLSSPTRDLPDPTPDSIRKRLSSLSLRSQKPVAVRPRTLSRPQSYRQSTHEDIHAEDFDISSIEQHARVTRSSPPLKTWSEKRLGFNLLRLVGVFGVLTVGITVPALSWYCAVPLTSMADITTIYNTYAIWALVFSIWFLGEKWEKRKVFSVLLACGGVVLVAYGGAEHRRRPREPVPPTVVMHARSFVAYLGKTLTAAVQRRDAVEEKAPPSAPNNALLGDMLAFFGAVTMAAYEMAFKVVATLPDEEAQLVRFEGFRRDEDFSRQNGDFEEGEGLLAENDEEQSSQRNVREVDRASTAHLSPVDTERTAIWKAPGDGDLGATQSPSYQSVTPAVADNDVDEAPLDGQRDAQRHNGSADSSSSPQKSRTPPAHQVARSTTEQDWIPPPLPFGLQPIIMTSGIGIMTLSFLWIGIPIANALGWEPFELPPNFATVFYLFVVAFTGIIFNGCFSILLALWGPVLASVSCLLTTVLVFFADLVLGHDFHWISLLGCASIVAGFGVLVSGGEV